MPSEESQKLWKYSCRLLSFTSPAPSGMFLVFWERTCLLLTTQGTRIVVVSSLPVSLSVTSLAWNLPEPRWKDFLLSPPSKSHLETWNMPYLAAGREPEVDSRWTCSAGRMTVSAWLTLGHPPMPGVKPKQMHVLAPRAAALKHLMMGQVLEKEIQTPPPLPQLRTELTDDRDDSNKLWV